MESKQFLEILCLQVMGWYLWPKIKPAIYCRANVWIQDSGFLNNSPNFWSMTAFSSASAKFVWSNKPRYGNAPLILALFYVEQLHPPFFLLCVLLPLNIRVYQVFISN